MRLQMMRDRQKEVFFAYSLSLYREYRLMGSFLIYDHRKAELIMNETYSEVPAEVWRLVC